MPDTLAPDEVRDAVSSLRRMVNRYTPTGDNADDPEGWILVSRIVAERLRSLWSALCDDLNDGADAAYVQGMAAHLTLAIGDWLEVARLLMDEGGRVARESGRSVKGLTQLEAEAVALRGIGDAACKVVDAAYAGSGVPLDPRRLQEAEAAFAQGRYKQGRHVIARLRRPKTR
jgi:hypothetical protein